MDDPNKSTSKTLIQRLLDSWRDHAQIKKEQSSQETGEHLTYGYSDPNASKRGEEKSPQEREAEQLAKEINLILQKPDGNQEDNNPRP